MSYCTLLPAQAIIFIVPWLLSAHFLGGLQSLHKTTTNTLSVVCPSPYPHPLTPHTYTNTPLYTHTHTQRWVEGSPPHPPVLHPQRVVSQAVITVQGSTMCSPVYTRSVGSWMDRKWVWPTITFDIELDIDSFLCVCVCSSFTL